MVLYAYARPRPPPQHLRARAHAQSRAVVCRLHALSPADRAGAESTASTSDPPSITTGFIFSHRRDRCCDDCILTWKGRGEHYRFRSAQQSVSTAAAATATVPECRSTRRSSRGHALVRHGFNVIFIKLNYNGILYHARRLRPAAVSRAFRSTIQTRAHTHRRGNIVGHDRWSLTVPESTSSSVPVRR